MKEPPCASWYLPLKMGVLAMMAYWMSVGLRSELGLSKGLSFLVTVGASVLLSWLADKAMTCYQKKEKK